MGVMLSAASCLKWWTDQINPDVSITDLLFEAEKSNSRPELHPKS